MAFMASAGSGEGWSCSSELYQHRDSSSFSPHPALVLRNQETTPNSFNVRLFRPLHSGPGQKGITIRETTLTRTKPARSTQHTAGCHAPLCKQSFRGGSKQPPCSNSNTSTSCHCQDPNSTNNKVQGTAKNCLPESMVLNPFQHVSAQIK